MNILVVPDIGRSYNSVRPEAEIYIGLAKKGHQITVMTDLNSAYVDEYQKANIEVIHLKPGKKLHWSGIKQINAIIQQKNIDIVYATKSRTIPNAAFACIGTKAKMIAYRGTTGGLYKTDLSNYLSILNPRIDGLVCVADSVTEHAKKKLAKSKHANITTIYKGHHFDWYQEPAVDLTTLGSSQEHFNIMCVGSYRPHKGTDYVLKTMALLADLTNLRLILVGDNLNQEPFNSLIQNNPAKSLIIRTGFRKDAPQISKACDFTLLPSTRKEGLPRTILESLASGTPVIATDIPGSMEIIKDNYNGRIVPANNCEALANTIRELYFDKEQCLTLKSNAQAVIETTFSHQSTVDNYERYFQQLLT